MKRLTIHLKHVEKTDNKVFNTLSFTVKNQTEITHHLSMNDKNVSKHYLSNF